MEKIKLYLFDNEISIEKPKTFKELRKIISLNFLLSEKNSNLIKFFYNVGPNINYINDNESLRKFNQKGISNLYLDINEHPEIFEDYLKLKFNAKDDEELEKLKQLLLKDDEYKKAKIENSIQKDEEELQNLNEIVEKYLNKIKDLKTRIANKKCDIENHNSVKKELSDLQLKLGLPLKYDLIKEK